MKVRVIAWVTVRVRGEGKGEGKGKTVRVSEIGPG